MIRLYRWFVLKDSNADWWILESVRMRRQTKAVQLRLQMYQKHGLISPAMTVAGILPEDARISGGLQARCVLQTSFSSTVHL